MANRLDSRPGTRLMLDDRAISEMSGLTRVSHSPAKYGGEPVLGEEHPWEHGLIYPHAAVYDDELQVFHLWYRAVDAPNGTPDPREHACYARSVDGITWEKPVIGEVEYDGSTRNNIIGMRTPMDVMTDHDLKPPAGRLFGFWSGEQPFSLSFHTSDDGIHWEELSLPETGDLRRASEESPPDPLARYFTTDQYWAGKNAWGANKRGIMRCESRDLVRWGGRRIIFAAGPDDDVGLEYYTMHPVGRRMSDTYAGLHLGFLHNFHTDIHGRRNPVNKAAMSGTIDVSLVLSTDTVDWQAPDRSRPFVPTGPEGAFDSGMVFLSSMIERGDELLFHYSGWNIEHGQLMENPERIGRADVGLARMRLDGFASVEPADVSGMLTTTTLPANGEALELNADASYGEIRVEVVGVDGASIPGYSLRDCVPVRDGAVHRRVTWTGGRDLPDLAGADVSLRIHLSGNARLYSFTILPTG